MSKRGYFSRHGKRAQLLKAFGAVQVFNDASAVMELYR